MKERNDGLRKILYSSITKVVAAILLSAIVVFGAASAWMYVYVIQSGVSSEGEMYTGYMGVNVVSNYFGSIVSDFTEEDINGESESDAVYSRLADSANIKYAIINAGSDKSLEKTRVFDSEKHKLLYATDGYMPDLKNDRLFLFEIYDGEIYVDDIQFTDVSKASCFRPASCNSWDHHGYYDSDDIYHEPEDPQYIYFVYQALFNQPVVANSGANELSWKLDDALSDAYYYSQYFYEIYSLAALIFPLCGILVIALFVFLTIVAGRRADLVGVKVSFLDKMWLEPFLLVMVGLVIGLGYFFASVYATDVCYGFSNGMEIVFPSALIMAASLICIITWMSLVTRFKAKVLWKNTLVNQVGVRFVKFLFHPFIKIGKNWPLMLKVMIPCGMVSLIEFFIVVACAGYAPGGILIFVFIKVLELLVIAFVTFHLSQIRDGVALIKAGDYESKVDTRYMLFSMKEFADNVNKVSFGMSYAIDEQIKSERMKTQLITNVSHDIKTPLTSIINYVDLLEKEDIENAKAKEYMEVLHRQSLRLKKLIENLIEASKASSGALEMNMSECDTHVVISQLMGEYSDRAEKADIDIVINQPEEPMKIMADGRYLWRVFDNVLSNICKYSMPNTRAYVDVKKENGNVVMVFKNISSEALNISVEELMERFVRGDESRNKEGNGLGLAIARDLTSQMGGKFDLAVDGDLFKVIVSFPAV